MAFNPKKALHLMHMYGAGPHTLNAQFTGLVSWRGSTWKVTPTSVLVSDETRALEAIRVHELFSPLKDFRP